ncbi:dolichol-phosphate mannosyltransferase [Allocatelliglobosispora scoriae]|uniref:Dolichol-phosphate mannosyltransferase n=1 Tax=Allocatelliglobosispora scoriae TaxID=643052 RepID=A0A841C468_9ACTN|nr:glycosyltransferase family 2 protein [Allocatelliglobosispora scoriae]MBB5873852.1 dolichol-phosphate mannosyltransferase [Allocatelliglobosispora scoriae]
MTAGGELALSVVIPMFNEEAVLPLLVQRLRPVLDGLGETYEVVAVDDGSADDTAAILHLLRRNWPELRLVRLRRNSGHQAALTAGLHRSRGDYVVSLDADLQDPPEVIPEMLELARSRQLDIVYGVRGDRESDTVFKRNTAGLYYTVMRKIVGKKMPDGAGDFRLLSRAMVEALRSLPEHTPVYRLLVPWLGFPSGEVSYVREKRAAGSTKYPLTKMIRLAADSVINFTAAPLRAALWLGAFGVGATVVLTATTLIAWANGTVVPGWTSLFLAVLLFGAVQLICLGLLGEYVGRIFQALQARPAYFISEDTVEARPPSQRGAEPDAEAETDAPAQAGANRRR